jgi:hypothetical protein
MFFLPITLDVLSTWRRRAGGLNRQERQILRILSSLRQKRPCCHVHIIAPLKALSVEDESSRLAILRKLVDLGEEGIDDEDLLFRCVTEDCRPKSQRDAPRLGTTHSERCGQE